MIIIISNYEKKNSMKMSKKSPILVKSCIVNFVDQTPIIM